MTSTRSNSSSFRSKLQASGPSEDVGPGNQNDRVEIGERRGDLVNEPRQRQVLPEIGEEPTGKALLGGELRGQVFGSRR